MKLIAIDMDGTLLNDQRKVTEENAKAIKFAQQKGIEVVIATGRDDKEARIPLTEAGLSCPVISVNGAEIQTANKKLLQKTSLARTTVKEITEILKENDVYYEIYTNQGAFTDDYEAGIQTVIDVLKSAGSTNTYEEMRKIAKERFSNGAVTHIEDYEVLFSNQNNDFYKVLAFSHNDSDRERARRKLDNMEAIAVSSSASENLEITHKHAQKGVALREYATLKGILLEDVMVIGDNGNDLSMFEVAGVSVAMKNAIPKVKEAADEVTLSNDDSGVAIAIMKKIKS
ncbi:Cof-type HAD-IIB family hydrolase [Bacillus sp. FJAT-45037]|uniref:Cof-type HAD-IIB family hydrolase n=1 Tax=Bacillus sp. FJAT-45037 TaxID=2011007 RepID=UPI000C23B30E|nr:Cof-type HAD-IIB family hydrolase [Bacillus sp. FJAT-45037]